MPSKLNDKNKIDDVNQTDDVNYYMYPGRDALPPESFYRNIYKYKNINDYLNKLKKKRKAKKSRMRKRAMYLIAGLDNNLDYSIDKKETFPPIGQNSVIEESLINGGIVDHVTPGPDFWGNDIGDTLNYGVAKDNPELHTADRISELFNQLISTTPQMFDYQAETSTYGMPDGINPQTDKDYEYNPNGYYPEYGYKATDLGNLTYENRPWIS